MNVEAHGLTVRFGRHEALSGIDLRMATGEVLVTDAENHRVVSWRLADGGGLRVVRSVVEGSGEGQLSFPWGLVTSSDGAQLWVADSNNFRFVDRLCLFR